MAAVLEHARDGIVIADHEGKIVEFNPAAERIFGHRRRDVIGHDMVQVLVHQDFRAEQRRWFAACLAGQGGSASDRPIDTRALRADGTEYPVEFSAARVPSEPPSLALFVRDAADQRMVDDLKRANAELTVAYDTTIEGWSRALDLRNRDAEGHTIRVAGVAVRLARAVGVRESDLPHVRRGALLHDIGKIMIPDSILLKPGPLDDEEWEVMRRHPVYAHALLSPVAHLRPALDIPYAHHEKWDGTGYPRHLRGEAIPLAARAFAVVDVWDALRSDRPYRAAWTDQAARDYIRDQAGTHFDPRIAQAFHEMTASPPHGK